MPVHTSPCSFFKKFICHRNSQPSRQRLLHWVPGWGRCWPSTELSADLQYAYSVSKKCDFVVEPLRLVLLLFCYFILFQPTCRWRHPSKVLTPTLSSTCQSTQAESSSIPHLKASSGPDLSSCLRAPARRQGPICCQSITVGRVRFWQVSRPICPGIPHPLESHNSPGVLTRKMSKPASTRAEASHHSHFFRRLWSTPFLNPTTVALFWLFLQGLLAPSLPPNLGDFNLVLGRKPCSDLSVPPNPIYYTYSVFLQPPSTGILQLKSQELSPVCLWILSDPLFLGGNEWEYPSYLNGVRTKEMKWWWWYQLIF